MKELKEKRVRTESIERWKSKGRDRCVADEALEPCELEEKVKRLIRVFF